MVLDGAMENRLNRVNSVNSTFCRGLFWKEHGFQGSKQEGDLLQPQWLQFLAAERGCKENQSSRFLFGGARLCGKTTGEEGPRRKLNAQQAFISLTEVLHDPVTPTQ